MTPFLRISLQPMQNECSREVRKRKGRENAMCASQHLAELGNHTNHVIPSMKRYMCPVILGLFGGKACACASLVAVNSCRRYLLMTPPFLQDCVKMT